MGDSGEGLVDAQDRLQQRLEEIEQDNMNRKRRLSVENPELKKAVESLRLARTQLERQLTAATHGSRKAQINQAMEELDRRLALIT